MSAVTVSLPRVRGMAQANARLMTRNRVTLLYAFALPLTPMAMLFMGDDGYAGLGQMYTMASVLLLALLFPIYYNTLSQVVTRRDELVLKRLRTSEARDAEILAAIAVPGIAITLGIAALALPIGVAAGMDLPANPLLYAVTALGCSVMFSAFAFWTAAWTRNAEAAQLTSAPILLLAMAGLFVDVVPETASRWLELTPGGLVTGLVEASWSTEGFTGSWSDAVRPLSALVVWTVLAVQLARRSMRWEPRD